MINNKEMLIIKIITNNYNRKSLNINFSGVYNNNSNNHNNFNK